MNSIDFFCNLAEPATVLLHFWEHTVGSDHAPVALRADWQSQLERCHNELGFQYVRFHGLLSDDMGTLVREKNQLLYSFFNADKVFDFLLSIGMRPFVELSFMPTALASGKKTVFSYKANVTPPRYYKQWATLIQKLVSHWIERYGVAEVRQWFFEVWNEPNLKSFWTGTQRDYFRLYRHTAEAIKSVDASLRVGGPATAKSEWIDDFVDFCERNKVPADFITTHQYPTDGFESDEETEVQLFKSQRGIMREVAQDTRRQARSKPVYYTEWNSSSNPRDPLHDEPYAAAFAVSTIMEARSLVEGYSFWTFSDIFEENYFPSAPFHGGFGLLNLHGIPKPTYRAFELLHNIGTEQFLVAIEGRILDPVGAPLSQTEIIWQTDRRSVLSRTDGSFTLAVPVRGQTVILVRRLGYDAQILRVDLSEGSWRGTIVLQPGSLRLPDVVVDAKYAKPAEYAGTTRFDDFFQRKNSAWARSSLAKKSPR